MNFLYLAYFLASIIFSYSFTTSFLLPIFHLIVVFSKRGFKKLAFLVISVSCFLDRSTGKVSKFASLILIFSGAFAKVNHDKKKKKWGKGKLMQGRKEAEADCLSSYYSPIPVIIFPPKKNPGKFCPPLQDQF